MIVYILMAIVIIAVGASLYRKEKPHKGLFVLFLMLVIVSAIRGEMSEDHPEYNEFFEYLSGLSWKTVLKREFIMEKGFTILTKLIACVSKSKVIYALVISIITMALNFYAYKKFSAIPWLSVLLFFSIGDYFDSFNIVRNILAAAICLFAIVKFAGDKKKSFIKYALFVLLASTIHTSALVMLPMYFVFKIKFSAKTLIGYLGVGLGIFAFLPKLIDLFMKIFPQYLLYAEEDIGVTNFNIVLPTLGVFLFVVICIFFYKSDIDLEEDNNRIAMHGLTLALIFMIASTQSGLAYRFAHFFKPFVAISAVNTIACFRSSKNRNTIIALISIVAIVAVWIFYRESPYDPYYVHDEVMEFFR